MGFTKKILLSLFIVSISAVSFAGGVLGTLTMKEIRSLPKVKQIEYIKALRELALAAEQVQNAFYGPEFYGGYDFKRNEIFRELLIGEAWAADTGTSLGSCIIAANKGVYKLKKDRKNYYCNLTNEQKAKSKVCGTGKILCNEALYGEKACIDFKKDNKNTATERCNKEFKLDEEKNFKSLLAYYEKNQIGKDHFKDLEEAINNVRGVCGLTADGSKKDKSKKSGVQKDTCHNLANRLAGVSQLLCKSQSGSGAVADARKKACKEAEVTIAAVPAAVVPAPAAVSVADACKEKAKENYDKFLNVKKICKETGYSEEDDIEKCYKALDYCRKNPDFYGTDYRNDLCLSLSPVDIDDNESKKRRTEQDTNITLALTAEEFLISGICPAGWDSKNASKSKLKEALSNYDVALGKVREQKIDNCDHNSSFPATDIINDCYDKRNKNISALNQAKVKVDSFIDKIKERDPESLKDICGESQIGNSNQLNSNAIEMVRSQNQKIHDLAIQRLQYNNKNEHGGVARAVAPYMELSKTLNDWYNNSNEEGPNFKTCCNDKNAEIKVSDLLCKKNSDAIAFKYLGVKINNTSEPKEKIQDAKPESAK